MASAAQRWRSALEEWTIPEEILRQAPEPPWGFPVELFRAQPRATSTNPSRLRALEALPSGGSVLDVGCGGGAAGLALSPTAGLVVGVDESGAMLEEMDRAATAAGVEHRTIRIRWPEGAEEAPVTDVVVCHNVAYNVADLAGFCAALSVHARRRVVMEITDRHPLVGTRRLWKQFHGLDRPDGPDASLAAEVLAEGGIRPTVEKWQRPPRVVPRQAMVAFMRRRLCLPAEREPDVEAAMGEEYETAPRDVVTLWWDAGS